MIGDERPQQLRSRSVNGPLLAAGLAVLLGFGATGQSCEDRAHTDAIRDKTLRLQLHTAALRTKIEDDQRVERWRELQGEARLRQENWLREEPGRRAARTFVEVAPGRLMTANLSELNRQRAENLAELDELAAFERTGAHGREGVLPPTISLVQEGSSMMVTNLAAQPLEVKVSLHGSKDGRPHSCAMYSPIQYGGKEYGPAEIAAGARRSFYVSPSSDCRNTNGMFAGVEVHDTSGMIWASDAVLEYERTLIRYRLVDLDRAIALASSGQVVER
jgi:hypothetical protein